MTGALYRLRDDGLVDVDNNGLVGTFRYDGAHVAGALRSADPHMLLWLAGPQLTASDNVRRNR